MYLKKCWKASRLWKEITVQSGVVRNCARLKSVWHCGLVSKQHAARSHSLGLNLRPEKKNSSALLCTDFDI